MIGQIKQVFEASTNRLRDPILGPFMLFNIAFNWKFFLVLVSSEKVTEKIDKAQSVWCWWAFIAAIIITPTYVLLWPKFLKRIDQIITREKVERRNAIQREEVKSELISLANRQSTLFYKISRVTIRPGNQFTNDSHWREFLKDLYLDQDRATSVLRLLNGEIRESNLSSHPNLSFEDVNFFGLV